MMKLRYIITILLLGLISCSEKDNLLIENIEVTTTFNPETSILTGSEITAWMTNDSTIEGYGGGYAFRTKNNFESFSITPGEIVGNPIYYSKQGTIVSANFQNGKGLITNDYFGGSYRVINQHLSDIVAIPGVYSGRISSPLFFFHNPTDGIVAARFKKSHSAYEIENGVKFLKLIDGGLSLISQIASNEFVPIDIEFYDQNLGYTLLTKFQNSFPGYSKQMYLSKTTDGGNTWSEPEQILTSNVVPQKVNKILLTSINTIVLYSNNQIQGKDYMFISKDGGINWGSGWLKSEYLNSLQYINRDIAYYVDRKNNYSKHSNIYKTTNGGIDWEQINLTELYADNVYFVNEEIGIAYTNNVIQITKDGGKTWSLIARSFN